MNLNKNQIIGIVILISATYLGLFWDKSFDYSNVFDTTMGVFSAIGLSMIIKVIPFKKKLKKFKLGC